MPKKAEQHGGVMAAPLTEREARVIPLALEWDRLQKIDDPEAVKAHIEACYAADCPDMARRAERLLRGQKVIYRTVGIRFAVYSDNSI